MQQNLSTPSSAKTEARDINAATPRTTTRKIGNTTFLVSSSFSSTGSGDVVSKIARLIRDEVEKGA